MPGGDTPGTRPPLGAAARRTAARRSAHPARAEHIDPERYYPSEGTDLDFVAAALAGQCTRFDGDEYVLLGDGPIQASIRRGLDDALKLVVRVPGQHSGRALDRLLCSQATFELDSIQYAQLGERRIGNGPMDPPDKPYLFQLVPGLKHDRTKKGQAAFFVWSPMAEDWLVQLTHQKRKGSMCYRMVYEQYTLLITCKSSDIDEIHYQLQHDTLIPKIEDQVQIGRLALRRCVPSRS